MSQVKVILRNDVEGVGHRGEVVEVSKGYVRNYLEPLELAITATPGALAQAEAMRKSRDVRDAAARESAEEIARVMVTKHIVVTAQAGDSGKLFGSVTASEISDAVSEQAGLDIDRKAIRLEDPIKAVGEYHVMARLHSSVEFPLNIEVVAG